MSVDLSIDISNLKDSKTEMHENVQKLPIISTFEENKKLKTDILILQSKVSAFETRFNIAKESSCKNVQEVLEDYARLKMLENGISENEDDIKKLKKELLDAKAKNEELEKKIEQLTMNSVDRRQLGENNAKKELGLIDEREQVEERLEKGFDCISQTAEVQLSNSQHFMDQIKYVASALNTILDNLKSNDSTGQDEISREHFSMLYENLTKYITAPLPVETCSSNKIEIPRSNDETEDSNPIFSSTPLTNCSSRNLKKSQQQISNLNYSPEHSALSTSSNTSFEFQEFSLNISKFLRDCGVDGGGIPVNLFEKEKRLRRKGVPIAVYRHVSTYWLDIPDVHIPHFCNLVSSFFDIQYDSFKRSIEKHVSNNYDSLNIC
ncbi:unnamed protein product [Caenorhabditis angaria]|uniref:Uncharacterized protein n=1 Tax=Caenorhabditis angaria TaxID=860376 RepID=A0A9P1N2B3_9PELO|nr:unnamed protein product [Caenorhabditis angaria]